MQDLARLRLCGVLQRIVGPVDQLATPDEEDLYGGFPVVAGEGDHVLVGVGRAEDALLLGDLFKRAYAVAVDCGALELELLACLVHLLAQHLNYALLLAFQKKNHLLDRLIVSPFVSQRGARTEAAVDEVLSARTLVVACYFLVTCAERE